MRGAGERFRRWNCDAGWVAQHPWRFAGLAAVLRRTPFLLTFHAGGNSSAFRERARGTQFRILTRYGIDYADRTVSLHEAARRAVEKIQGEASTNGGDGFRHTTAELGAERDV